MQDFMVINVHKLPLFLFKYNANNLLYIEFSKQE